MTRPNPFFELRKELPIIFWPVLFLSLKWFIGYVAELRAAGHQAIKWHVTWYGVIKVTWVDEIDPLCDLKALPSWEAVQARINANACGSSLVGWDAIPPCLGPDAPWRDSIPPYGAGRDGVLGGVCGKKLEPVEAWPHETQTQT